jgi:HEAT repeat protein
MKEKSLKPKFPLAEIFPLFTNQPLDSYQLREVIKEYGFDEQSIEILELDTRSHNALEAMCIGTLAKLLLTSPRQLLRMRGCGRKSLHKMQESMLDFFIQTIYKPYVEQTMRQNRDNILSFLQDSDNLIRQAILEQLRDGTDETPFQNPAVLEQLIHLLGDSDSRVRKVAFDLFCVRRICDERAVAPFLLRLCNEEKRGWVPAWNSHESCNNPIYRAIFDMGDLGYEKLIAIAKDLTAHMTLRERAIQAIGHAIGYSSCPLMELLNDSDTPSALRWKAAVALGKRWQSVIVDSDDSNREILHDLFAPLEVEIGQGRQFADTEMEFKNALAELDQSVESLQDILLQNEVDPLVRLGAVQGLGLIRIKSCLPVLADVLATIIEEDDEPYNWLTLNILDAINKITTPEQFERLMDLLGLTGYVLCDEDLGEFHFEDGQTIVVRYLQ